MTPACVIEAITEVIDSIADNLTMHNALDYVDLPDHTTVASVRRLRQSTGQGMPRLHQTVIRVERLLWEETSAPRPDAVHAKPSGLLALAVHA